MPGSVREISSQKANEICKSLVNYTTFLIYIINFVVTPHNFIIAKLSIRKPGSSSVLIISHIKPYSILF